mgnify:CR=1 FL=1
MNKIENITVKQAIDRYIESKYAVLSPSTVKGYMIVKRNQLQNLMEILSYIKVLLTAIC